MMERVAAPAARRLPPTERRAQIAAAAVGVFAARPEEEVGLEDLAAAAGVTRNLLYRYFESRAALHRAAVEEAIRRVGERHDTDPGRPLAAKLPRNVAVWLDAVERDDDAMRLLLRAGRSDDPQVVALVAAGRELLARAIARNHLDVDDPPRPVLAALDGYLALAERLVERWGAGDLDRAGVERVLSETLPPLVAAARAAPLRRPRAGSH